jgi:nocardicin N-oxygenase
VSREFLADAVAGYRTYVAAESERLWSAAEAVDGPIDLVEHLALPLTWAVATKLLGLPGDAQTVAQTAAATVMKADWNTSEEIVSAYLQLWAYLGDFVSGKRATAPDGLVRTLRDRRADGYPLNDDEITGLVFSILLAGTQTASNVLVKALWVLLSAQSAAKSLRANPSLLSGWIEENSRLIPGGEILTTVRVAYRDVELPNGLIKVGDTVFPDAFLANRDPEVFSDPLRFDPTRGRTRHFGFGHGLHHCLGQALVRVELEAVLSGLLSRNPALRADTASLKWENGLIFYRPKQLPIVFEH